MRRVTNFAEGSIVPSATLNRVQDEQVGLRTASGSSTGPTLSGADQVYWQTPDAGVASATIILVDASCDWRARRVSGVFRKLGSSAQRTGQSGAYQQNDPDQGLRASLVLDQPTATGATGAASATIANGVPPVFGSASAPVIAWEGSSASERVWLYARPADGALYLYNASGATLHAELRFVGSSAAPTAGDESPSEIPTVTEIAWIEPALAADRPSAPGDGRYIFRATDTGDISLWDGAAWRSFGSGGGVANPLTADLDADGFTVTNLAAPAADGDAANRAYVDSAAPQPDYVVTTDATPTVIETVSVGASQCYLARIELTAAGTTKAGAWVRHVAFRSNALGAITALSSVDTMAATTGTGWDTDPTVHLAVDIGSGEVTVSVVGIASASLHWNWRITTTGGL